MKVQKDINGKLVLSDEQVNKTVQRIINKKKKYGTSTFIIQINGKEVTVVKYRELIDLDKLSPSSRRKVVREYIKRVFLESTIKTIDNKTIIIKSTSGAKKILFANKQRIVLYIEDLIRDGMFLRTGPDYGNELVVWHYYDCYISFGKTILYGRINIKEIDNSYRFYDINKIKEVETSTGLNSQRVSEPH